MLNEIKKITYSESDFPFPEVKGTVAERVFNWLLTQKELLHFNLECSEREDEYEFEGIFFGTTEKKATFNFSFKKMGGEIITFTLHEDEEVTFIIYDVNGEYNSLDVFEVAKKMLLSFSRKEKAIRAIEDAYYELRGNFDFEGIGEFEEDLKKLNNLI